MALPLVRAVSLLEGLAPLVHAEEWDNVGLLLEPLADRRDPQAPPSVRRVLLCVNLTEPVLEEALSTDTDLIIAYHPPIFRPLKRLGTRAAGERIVQRAVRAGLAVYSPHTALDAAPGGVNDWLADGLGGGRRAPLVDSAVLEPGATHKVVTFVPAEKVDALRSALAEVGAGVIGDYTECASEIGSSGTFFGGADTNPTVGERGRLERVAEIRLELVCPGSALGRVARVMRDVHPYEEPAWDVYPLAARPAADFGQGRGVTLDEPVTLSTLVERLKRHVGRGTLRVAATEAQRGGAPVHRVAVGAGSGHGVFQHAANFDVYVTGELSHHNVLAHVAAGSSVILCEHSTSERGYLPSYAQKLVELSGGALEVLVAQRDREPLEAW